MGIAVRPSGWTVLVLLLMMSAQGNGAVFTEIEAFGIRGSGMAWGDFDGDGQCDLLVARDTFGGMSLYRNDGGCAFTELQPFGVPGRRMRGGVWADYDNDGRLDIAAASGISAASCLYHNDSNGVFSEVLLEDTSEQRRMVSWADRDQDGWVDLLDVRTAGNYILHNDLGKLSATHRQYWGWSACWADFDDDGYPDLADAADVPLLYQNVGDTFLLRKTIYDGFSYWLSTGDYNNDGRTDVASLDVDINTANLLIVNRGAFEFDTLHAFGMGGGWWGCAPGDCNNDGFLDLAVGVPGDLTLFLGKDGSTFTSQRLGNFGNVEGMAWCDCDDDGDLDLAVSNLNGQNHLLRNEQNDSNFVKLRLRGRGKDGFSNTMGINARVFLLDPTGGMKGSRELTAGEGFYPCMSSLEVHFGAPAADTFTVLVSWPASGIVDTIPNVIPPARLKVVETRRPGLFSLVSPAQGAETSRKPTLTWHRATDPDGDIVTYDLWYGKDPAFTTRTEVKALSDTTWTPSALLDSATYYWKVLAIDREHRVISYRNHYTDTMAVDSLGAQTWCTEQDWHFNATAAGISEDGGRQPRAQISLSVGQNPAWDAVRASYAAAAGGLLEVFSADGRLTLAQPVRGAGTLALGRSLPQGVYFIRLTSDKQERTAKVVKLD